MLCGMDTPDARIDLPKSAALGFSDRGSRLRANGTTSSRKSLGKAADCHDPGKSPGSTSLVGALPPTTA